MLPFFLFAFFCHNSYSIVIFFVPTIFNLR
uniref:Uncharacterized protein n=1 Tax=virus sp. ctpeS3 TaxID=2826815 RepID=A0A8S5R9M6_9VIRU|nr:MAG TPA: hypothetical protein [virus sp. ctpeS3]